MMQANHRHARTRCGVGVLAAAGLFLLLGGCAYYPDGYYANGYYANGYYPGGYVGGVYYDGGYQPSYFYWGGHDRWYRHHPRWRHRYYGGHQEQDNRTMGGSG